VYSQCLRSVDEHSHRKPDLTRKRLDNEKGLSRVDGVTRAHYGHCELAGIPEADNRLRCPLVTQKHFHGACHRPRRSQGASAHEEDFIGVLDGV
jgi:hypothetical protein